MIKRTILLATCLGAAIVASPVMAGQEATQEPGSMAFFYPDTDYNTGGYGARASPGPYYYYTHRFVGPGTALPFGPRGVTIYGAPRYYDSGY